MTSEDSAAQPGTPVDVEHDKPAHSQALGCLLSEEAILWGLPHALREFRDGGKLGDGGRAGMLRALNVAMSLLLSKVSDSSLIEPLSALRNAIIDLDKGALHPALVPLRRGRPQARQDILQFKSACLAASDLLHYSNRDRWPRQEADAEIYKRAVPPGRRLGMPLTRQSLATWRRDARKSLGRASKDPWSFGFWVWITSFQVQEMQSEGRDLETQIALLLSCASEDRLAHLPHPVKTPSY